ncbi:hypothetical protein [Pelagivirga sediminicola]|uniref:hypothetical protein n=1 Tax=Pelagivirga sediminicola TaxID=2170575 RepID=UPI00105750FD|nr:hypothetical protein [Pelagivirga sediminicola]
MATREVRNSKGSSKKGGDLVDSVEEPIEADLDDLGIETDVQLGSASGGGYGAHFCVPARSLDHEALQAPQLLRGAGDLWRSGGNPALPAKNERKMDADEDLVSADELLAMDAL